MHVFNSDYIKVPTKPRIQFAILEARKFLNRSNVIDFPIDLIKIIENNNWTVLYDYLNRTSNLSNIAPTSITADALACYVRHLDKYFIIMDIDSKKAFGNRFTFSMAHEIAHIALKHLKNFDTNNLTKNEKIILDKEADSFAGELLMPKKEIYKYRTLSVDELANIFNVTKLAMETRLSIINMK